MVKTTHTLRSGIYPTNVYSEGMVVKGNMSIIVQDITEWGNFLAGTDSSLNIVLTHPTAIPSSSPTTNYSLTFDLPSINYATGKFDTPAGLLKIPFAFESKKLIGNTYGLQATLVNGVSTQY